MNIRTDITAGAASGPEKALLPIRRLVTAAMICSFLAVGVLVSSAYHVMETTDDAEMVRERERASAIADIVGYDPAYATEDAILALGKAGGLRGLSLDPVAKPGVDSQSIPLLSGPQRGKFLTWTTSRPGQALFAKFAPIRLPVGIGLIGVVLATLMLMMRQVQQIERQRRDAQRQALRDHLTGLPNRLALESELERLAQGEHGFSLLAMDLDHFKPINDLFGHHMGDKTLVAVAKRLNGQMRPGEMLARVGGDEFVSIVHRDRDASELAELAQDCIASVSAPLPEVGVGIHVGISVGIVVDGSAHKAGPLLALADQALYEAKEVGGTYRVSGEQGALMGLRA